MMLLSGGINTFALRIPCPLQSQSLTTIRKNIYHITKTHAEYKRANFLFGFFVAILNCEIGSKVESIHYNSWEVH